MQMKISGAQMKIARCDLREHLPFLMFLVVITVLFTRPTADGDFYWHIKTGEWIWQQHEIPTSDPFSYTVADVNPFRPDSQRVQFVLRGYWLGQLLLFSLWELGGLPALVIFRALLFAAVLTFLYAWMRRITTGLTPLVAVFLVGNVLLDFLGQRPQIFSFAFFALLLLLLERVAACRGGIPAKYLVGLPLLMLVWANTHGAFLVGVAMIGIYGADHLLRVCLKKEEIDRQLLLLLAASVLLTLLNPNGYLAATEFVRTLPAYAGTVFENLSPVTAALKLRKYHAYYWAFLLLLLLAGCLRSRRIRPVHLAVLLSLAVLSLTAIRHIPFLLFAAPLLVVSAPAVAWNRARWFLAVLLLVVWAATANYKNVFNFAPHRHFPVAASKFLNAARPAGNLFNFYDWGGYLMVHSPGYKVFVDGRGLAEEFTLMHEQVMNGPQWREILNHYKVNTVIVPGTNSFKGTLNGIVANLVADQAWSLIYFDDVAIVFARKIPENREVIARYELDKMQAFEHVRRRQAWQFN